MCISTLSRLLCSIICKENPKQTMKRESKKPWNLPSISYNPYMLGNRPNTCSYHSCRHPNISVMHPFPDRGGRVRSGQALKEQVFRLGGTCILQAYLNAWVNVLIPYFPCILIHLDLWRFLTLLWNLKYSFNGKTVQLNPCVEETSISVATKLKHSTLDDEICTNYTYRL